MYELLDDRQQLFDLLLLPELSELSHLSDDEHRRLEPWSDADTAVHR